MGINSFTLAARKMNPASRSSWSNHRRWYDPAKEADAARALIDQGVDIITQHTDSPAALQVARGARCRGRLRPGRRHVGLRAERAAHLDRSTSGARTTSSAPRRCSTAPGPRPTTWDGLKEGAVVIGALQREGPGRRRRPPPKRSRQATDRRHAATSSPARSTTTTAPSSVAAGVTLTDGELLSMDWYVEGVNAPA